MDTDPLDQEQVDYQQAGAANVVPIMSQLMEQPAPTAAPVSHAPVALRPSPVDQLAALQAQLASPFGWIQAAPWAAMVPYALVGFGVWYLFLRNKGSK